MRILVTGADGMVGRNMQQLVANQIQITQSIDQFLHEKLVD